MMCRAQGDGAIFVGFPVLGPFLDVMALAVCCLHNSSGGWAARVARQDRSWLRCREQCLATIFVQDDVPSVPYLSDQRRITQHRSKMPWVYWANVDGF